MRFANFICETNAACTVNASLCIQDDAGTETHSFRPVYLFNCKTAAFRPIFVGLNLEWTLACLITDRAVQRVVDQQKFQRVFLGTSHRSEEHTSELQSRGHLVCRLLLERKNKNSDLSGRFSYIVVLQ